MRKTLALVALLLLAAGGYAATTFALGPSEHAACTPTHTISDNGNPLGEIPGDCVTATDQTVTVTTTETQTVTVTTGTTTPAPPPPPPPPPPAGNVYVSPLGADANPCSSALPCQSFNRGYRAASCGNTVEVAAGNYPGQDITDDPSKTSCSANVVIRPSSGASVTVGTLSLSGADHLTVQGPLRATGGVEVTSGANNSTVSGVNGDGSILYVASPTSNVIVSNSSFGNTNRVMSKIWLGPGGGQNVNLTLDGDTFHDVLSDDLNCCHVEGLLVIHENGLTIRNSTFTNNAVFDLSLGVCCGSALAGRVTLEGNHFNSVRSGVSDYTVASLNFNTNTKSFPPFTVRFNSFARGESGTPAPGTYCGNTGNAPAAWTQPCAP